VTFAAPRIVVWEGMSEKTAELGTEPVGDLPMRRE
jgi:hypothetical protein